MTLLQTHPVRVLLFLFLIIISVCDLTGQTTAEKETMELSRVGNVAIDAGKIFRHYRFAFMFELPVRSFVRLTRRKPFPVLEVKPVDTEDYLILHTSFRILNNSNIKKTASIISPCRFPSLPDRPEFRLEIICKGIVKGNKVKRKIILERENKLLHMFYVVYRLSSEKLINGIVSTLKRNKKFRFK